MSPRQRRICGGTAGRAQCRCARLNLPPQSPECAGLAWELLLPPPLRPLDLGTIKLSAIDRGRDAVAEIGGKPITDALSSVG